jgi:Tfp pilus assembly protein PilO
MNPLEMIVLVVLIVTIGHVIRSYSRRGAGQADAQHESGLRQEVKALKDRIAVLERIATDKEITLEREIEQLRDS